MRLNTDEIHIWCAALDCPPSQLNRFSQTLSADERRRAERFHFDKDRNYFIVRRGILRAILGSYLSVEPNHLQFCYGKYGKPALANASEDGTIRFNLSHSSGVALFTLTRDREIGVDIEYMRDIYQMDCIAERFFSEQEKQVFRGLPASQKKEAFFNCWTRKEAFIKAIGSGLYRPLDGFDVTLIPGEPAKILRLGGNSSAAFRWSIHELKLALGFVAAFAIEGQDPKVRCWQWSS